MSGTGDRGIEKAFAAEKHVLESLDILNIHGAGIIHHGHMTGGNQDRLICFQIVFNGGAVDFKERNAISGKTLHDKTLTGEKAGGELFLQIDGQFNAWLRGEERGFLDDRPAARGDFDRTDGTRETGGKGDGSRTGFGCIDVLERVLTGEHAAEHFPQTAAGGGLHFHVGAHPAHAAGFGNHGFSLIQVAHDDRQLAAGDLVLHLCPSVMSSDSFFRHRNIFDAHI